jgi:hypothetical protein
MNNLQPEYKRDFYAWTFHNADLLRNKKFEEIDIENLVEEIESMGRSNRRELISRFAVLISHLLKWQFQPIRRSKSWILTIKNQRLDIADLLQESPSLKHEIEQQFNHAYEKSILLASEQTGIDESLFPHECPYILEQCLDNKFFPE